MAIRTKSVYEQAEPEDGVRVLTTAYWPRGVAKARVDVYKRVLGPTRELLKAFKEDAIDWRTYERSYLELMAGEEQQEEIRALAEAAVSEQLTIMCMCKDESQCHRRLLAGLVEAAM